MNPGLLLSLLGSNMPEEILIEGAIDRLKAYRDEKFSDNRESKISNTSVEELKRKILSGEITPDDFAKKDTVKEVEPPYTALIILLNKWKDEGKSMEEIVNENLNG